MKDSWEDMEHFHKCGFLVGGKVAKDYCGTIWSHTIIQARKPENSKNAHNCPNCGEGPNSTCYYPTDKEMNNLRKKKVLQGVK